MTGRQTHRLDTRRGSVDTGARLLGWKGQHNSKHTVIHLYNTILGVRG